MMVRSYKKVLLIAKEGLYEWKWEYRVWIVGILTVVLLGRYLHGINLYGFTYGTRVTPFLLLVLFKDSHIANGLLKVLLYLGAICLLSNAPFVTDITSYQILRSGKRSWIAGKCMYIWLTSFLYVIFIACIAGIIVLPTVSVNDLWGSTLRDWVSKKNNWEVYAQSLEIPSLIIKLIYPWAAEILSLFVVGLSFCFLGHLIFFCNLLTNKKAIGIGLSVLFVMLDPVISYFAFSEQQKWMYLFSPINWSSLELWTIVGSGKPLSAQYAYGMYLLLILCLTAGIFIVASKKEILKNE